MLWIKAFHLVAVVAWFAGLLYLPRLFVYHAECGDDDAGKRRFEVMERRLFWQIMTPAAAAAVFLGLALVPRVGMPGWLAAKLALVALLLAFHAACWLFMRRLRAGRAPGGRFFRWFNEAPALLLVAIVCLAAAKPF